MESLPPELHAQIFHEALLTSTSNFLALSYLNKRFLAFSKTLVPALEHQYCLQPETKILALAIQLEKYLPQIHNESTYITFQTLLLRALENEPSPALLQLMIRTHTRITLLTRAAKTDIANPPLPDPSEDAELVKGVYEVLIPEAISWEAREHFGRDFRHGLIRLWLSSQQRMGSWKDLPTDTVVNPGIIDWRTRRLVTMMLREGVQISGLPKLEHIPDHVRGEDVSKATSEGFRVLLRKKETVPRSAEWVGAISVYAFIAQFQSSSGG